MNPAPPPVPAGPAPRKKPSVLASCILIGLIVGVLGVLGGGGYWAYHTLTGTMRTASVAEEPTSPPSTATQNPSTSGSTTTPSSRRSVLEPVTSATTTTPPDDPLAASVQPTTSGTSAIATDPASGALAEPNPEPAVSADPSGATPLTEPAATAAIAPVAGPADPAEPPLVVPTLPPTDDPAAAELPDPAILDPAATDSDPVVDAEPIQTLAEDSAEVASLKADADRRIDEAPAELYLDADKQRVRDAIRRAKRLTKVATLRFGSGAAALGSNERNRLRRALLTPEAEALMSDSQAVVFILGFADPTGTPETNRVLSQRRAAGVADVLKGFRVANTSYAVGIGATTLLSAERQSKNRAVEVWIVQP